MDGLWDRWGLVNDTKVVFFVSYIPVNNFNTYLLKSHLIAGPKRLYMVISRHHSQLESNSIAS